MKPLAIDLYAGLGGWSSGLLAEGYDCIGFDIEQHVYGEHRYPAQLVVQDVLTLHGSQFKTADLIVASPPCQEYSYMAMPWSRAKAKAAAIRADNSGTELARLTALFDACFRLQREACAAAGRHIPMVVENVKGAQSWVGRARWSFGSFYLWGDVPALMPIVKHQRKVQMASWRHPDDPRHLPGQGFNTLAALHTKNSGGSWFNVAHNTTSGKGRNPDGRKPRLRGCDCQHPETTPSGFAAISVDCPIHGDADDGPTITTVFPSSLDSTKVPTLGGGRRTDPGKGARFTTRDCGLEASGIKLKDQDGYERDHPNAFGWKAPRTSGNKGGSRARRMASALIAKIPEPLSRHIARTFYPHNQ